MEPLRGQDTYATIEGGVLYGLLGPADDPAPEVRTVNERSGWDRPPTTSGFMKRDPDFP